MVTEPTKRDGPTRTLTHPRLLNSNTKVKQVVQAQVQVLVQVVPKQCQDHKLVTKLVVVLLQATVVANNNNRNKLQLMMPHKCHTQSHN